MIFLEERYTPERRSAAGCVREQGGQFASGNQCQEGGDGNWSRSPQASVKWDSEKLKSKSPISGGEALNSLEIKRPRELAESIREVLPDGSDLDDAIKLGGGAFRGADIEVAGRPGEVRVQSTAPIDPGDPDGWQMLTEVTLFRDEDIGSVATYELFDIYKRPGAETPDEATTRRVSSLIMERMTESLVHAEEIGLAAAETFAIGTPSSGDKFKGYRLWPRFGFDGELPKVSMELLRSEADSAGLSPGARRKLKSGATLTVQEVIETREGQRWWDENGSSIDLRLDFRKKNSRGFKKFLRMKGLLPQLKERNKSRNWFDFDAEFRAADCGRQDGGRFTTGNTCAADDGGANVSGGGGATATAPAPADDSWRTQRTASWKQDAPIKGGDKISSLTIGNPAGLPEGIPLDDVVAIGGGAVRGSSISVQADAVGVQVSQSAPINPDDADAGSFGLSVYFSPQTNSVEYGSLAAMGTTKVSDEDKLRVASILKERMLESMIAAESHGITELGMQAAGSDAEDDLKGYRLWPQFGFDAKLKRHQITGIPPEVVLQAAGVPIPRPGSSRIPHGQVLAGLASQVTSLTVQQLISTREGKRWWDENGGDISLSLDLSDTQSLGYKRFQESKGRLPRLKERNKNRDWVSWIDDLEFRAADCGRNEEGEFDRNNQCQDGAGDGVKEQVKAAKERNVDVMLGGGPRVAVIDEQARQRAAHDMRENPKPEGSSAGSTTDVWGRTFVTRGGKSTNKITESASVFPPETHRQNGQFVAHESVGQYLSDRHEPARRAVGATGPGSIIDTASDDISEEQLQYLADALTEDALHAYDVLGVDPGFYSTDLEDTMRKMATRYPEFETDDNAKFIFTTLLAITSTGQGPDANLRDADDLYRMFREHGTVLPSNYGGGARDVTASLKVFQNLLDSFGQERTRRLLSGYTTAGRVQETFERLAGKSQAEEWRERTGSSAWSVPVTKKGEDKSLVSGELRDEIVPVAAIFGPKIGSFFANLSGRHDFLTMDRWLMRSVGRVSGELVTRSTPKQAKARAEEILKNLEKGKWSRAKLFGVDKTHGITKADLIRSLKIQARTGVIEENGAAFIWATAAERSHGKTRRPTGGGYGEHEDPEIHDLHTSGNSLFKSLIHEQQDPKTGTARRNIREVFRRIQAEIEKQTGRKADIDEIQAALWQYEKRLWKHLGAKTNIKDNSLFSAAADGILDGRLARSESHPRAKPFTPAARRDRRRVQDEEPEDEFDTNLLDAEQAIWDSNFAELGIDILEVIKALEEDVEERMNFAALDAVEYRDSDCGRQEGGKFGEGNTCAASNSRGEALMSARRRKDNTQTRVARKIYQMKMSEKGLKQMVRDLGGKVSNTLIEINSTYKDEGINLFIRDRDYNESLVMHIGYFGATVYVDEIKTSAEISRIENIVKAAVPKTIDERLFAGGSPYPVTVVNEPGADPGRFLGKLAGGKSSKQRYKDSRSADCGRQEGGRFATGNQCQEEGSGTGPTSGKKPTASQKKNKAAVEKARAISGPIKADDPRIEGFRKPFRPTTSPNSDFVSAPDDDDVKAALSSDKQEKFGKNRNLEEGHPVDLRIDIPAFERKGVYAVTVHEHTGTSRIGSPIGYDSVVRLAGNVSFSSDNEQLATSIMFGRDKTPLATVRGKFSKSREIPPDIDSWTPVGYDPKKATFFYDKKTGQEVLGGVDAISVGNSVFVRSPKKGRRNAATDYRSGGGFWISEFRSADCGRQQGGRFTTGNTCAADDGGANVSGGGGAATQATFGSTNVNQSFKGSDKPFRGAEKFDDVRVGGGKQVAKSMQSMGLDIGDAVEMATGGRSGSSLLIRPAPEHSNKGSGATLFNYESGGMYGSSVVANEGTPDNPALHIYHSMAEVDDSIRADDAKRHAAARAFFSTMTGSIESAVKAGAKRVTLNAAGSASPRRPMYGGLPNTFRGYTIWPRMGFDAPIPYNLKQKLPDSLSHAKSLLDLHATPEGTRWWRDNGTDIDVSFDLTDTSSPQFKIFEKFRRKFGTEKRELPLGSGDGWLSPGDLSLLDELWEEIWDDGDLDDYEWVERRAANCGTGSGGFAKGNTCAAGGETKAAATRRIRKSAGSSKNYDALLSFIESEIGTKVGFFSGPEEGNSKPSQVCEALGIKVANIDEIDAMHAKGSRRDRRGIASAIAQVSRAQKEVPGLLKGEVRIETPQSFAKNSGVSVWQVIGVAGSYSAYSDSLSIMAVPSGGSQNSAYAKASGWISTDSDYHTVVHEMVHRDHYKNIIKKTGVKPPGAGSSDEQILQFMKDTTGKAYENMGREINADPDWASRVASKAGSTISKYATADPFELVAEYSTAVQLGSMKNDPDLDRACKALYANVPKRYSR